MDNPSQHFGDRVPALSSIGSQTARNDFAPFVGCHAGERAFIIGNGPSLNEIDMRFLEDEITFGSNRAYLGFKSWGYHFKYWACQDELQIKQGIDYYNRDLPDAMIKFVPNEHLGLFTTANTHGVNILWRVDDFPQFAAGPNVFFEGWTVTYLLLQIAYLMGCNPIYLVGVDYSYNIGNSEMRGKKWTDSQSSSHFIKDYMAEDKGVVWNLPNFQMTDLAFACAATTLRSRGVTVQNATPGSRLNVFQKVEFQSIFTDEPRLLNRFGERHMSALIVGLSDNATDILRAQNACPEEYDQRLLAASEARVPPDTETLRYTGNLDTVLPQILAAGKDVDRIYLSVSYRVQQDADYRGTIGRILNGLPAHKRGVMIGDKPPAATLDDAIAIDDRVWVE